MGTDVAASGFRALDGVVVLDWTEGVAGPYACQVMGDLGADVIKIERPEGDWGREMGGGGGGGGPHFRALNRNKRDLCLDLRRPEAVEVAWRLIQRADVMVTSYRPGVTERLGLGYEAVRARAQRLVYARVSAYGYAGPLAQRPGSDTILQATSGLMSQIGEPDGPPQRVGVPVVDYLAARDTVIGVLAALLARGRGQDPPGPVDVSLFASATSVQSQVWQRFFEDGHVQTRAGHRNPGIAPAGLYPTRDGRYIAVAVLRDEHWRKFARALGLGDAVDDPRFSTNTARVANREDLEALVVPAFASRDFNEWAALLVTHDVLAGPVTAVTDIAGDEGLAAALPILEVPPGAIGKGGRGIGLPISFGVPAAGPGDVKPPPAKGQHTREVLAEAGYRAAEIEHLVASGVAPEAPTPTQSGAC